MKQDIIQIFFVQSSSHHNIMAEPTAYPQHARSAVNRYKSRATYDFSVIHSIVNSTAIVHVSFLPAPGSDDPFPTTLPMLGQMGSFSNPTADPATEPMDVYVHGHSASRLMRLPDSEFAEAEGFPVCIAATRLDGIVLALSPFAHSCNFRSAVIHGYASIVTDEDERLFAMRLMTNGLVAGRWENTRVPPTKSELQTTTILRIRVASASAKIRTGPASSDRQDLKNETVVNSVWTGVMPVFECVAPPEAGQENGVDKLPEYLGQWRDSKNTAGEAYACKVAVSEVSAKK